MLALLKRFSIVPVLSSAARIPRPVRRMSATVWSRVLMADGGEFGGLERTAEDSHARAHAPSARAEFVVLLVSRRGRFRLARALEGADLGEDLDQVRSDP